MPMIAETSIFRKVIKNTFWSQKKSMQNTFLWVFAISMNISTTFQEKKFAPNFKFVTSVAHQSANIPDTFRLIIGVMFHEDCCPVVPIQRNMVFEARSLVQWLGKKAHVQEVVGSNPAVYWMDVSDDSYYIFNEKRNKGSQMGHTKKKIFLRNMVNRKNISKC